MLLNKYANTFIKKYYIKVQTYLFQKQPPEVFLEI